MALSLRENVCRTRQLPIADDLLMARAELLAQKDRELIRAVMVSGMTMAAVARLTGMNERTVRYRVRRLGRKLASRRFLNAARSLPYLSEADARIARFHYCEGLSGRRLARQEGMSFHLLRRRLDRIRAEIDTIAKLTTGGAARQGRVLAWR